MKGARISQKFGACQSFISSFPPLALSFLMSFSWRRSLTYMHLVPRPDRVPIFHRISFLPPNTVYLLKRLPAEDP